MSSGTTDAADVRLGQRERLRGEIVKPRLFMRQTAEDWQIWVARARRADRDGRAGPFLKGCLESDRRDAELMLKAQQMRTSMLPDRPCEIPIFGGWYLVRGELNL